jgi:hypothetical protein
MREGKQFFFEKKNQKTFTLRAKSPDESLANNFSTLAGLDLATHAAVQAPSLQAVTRRGANPARTAWRPRVDARVAPGQGKLGDVFHSTPPYSTGFATRAKALIWAVAESQ